MSMLSSGVSASGPASATKASSAPAGRSARSAPSPSAGTGCSGSMWSRWSPEGGDRREGVELGTECAQWADQLGADDGAAEAGGFHHRPGPAAQELGDLGEDGSRRIRPMEVTSSGTVSVHWRQVWRTSAVRSIGKNSAPRIQLGHRIQHSSRSRSRRRRCRPRL
jgi:hypothetical protein